MKRKLTIALLCRVMMSSIMLLFTGCGPVIYNKLPNNVAKGYVEFYSKDETGFVGQVLTGEVWQYQWNVWKCDENGMENKIFVPERRLSWTQRRRIAERPGMYTFVVKFGSANKEVTVEVAKGMITPVSVKIIKKSKEGDIERSTIYFEMYVNAEPPIPFVK